MIELPPLSSLVHPDEYVLSDAQEELLRMEAAHGEVKRPRWLIAALGADPPDVTQVAGICIEPWSPAWVPANDPTTDLMIGICILSEADSQSGLLIFLDPSPEMRRMHAALLYPPTGMSRPEYYNPPPAMLGSERSIRCAPPDADYRMMWPWIKPLRELNGRTVRWSFGPPQFMSPYRYEGRGWVPLSEPARRPEVRS